MFAQRFFQLFPPPKLLDVPYAGLDISDDAIRCVEYASTPRGLRIRTYGTKLLPEGVVEGGEIKDERVLSETLSAFSKEFNVRVVKASLSEERMYLFKTTVPSTNIKETRQNIEFKLEENVPLAVDEALFFFDYIPRETGVVILDTEIKAYPVGVSVAPRVLVTSYLDVIKKAGITVLSFEVNAKGLARSLVPKGSVTTDLLVHIMEKKTGMYVVCGGVVCFTSTIAWGINNMNAESDTKKKFEELKKSLQQVKGYWKDHGLGTAIKNVRFSGKGSTIDGLVSECAIGFSLSEENIKFEIGHVWQNAFSYENHIPTISHEESLEYGVAAGLALPFSQ